MGDRTNITDARQHDAEQAAGVIEQAMRNEGLIDKDVRLMGEIIAEALDAAGFDVVLRADPDTSDERPSDLTDELAGAELWSAALRSNVDNGVTRGYSVESITELADLLDTLHDGVYRMEAERDADVSAGAVARTVAMSHIAAERDAERAARERAEAEARQLREAIREHKDRHNSWRQQTQRPSDIALWAALNAAAVAEGAEDRGQTDG